MAHHTSPAVAIAALTLTMAMPAAAHTGDLCGGWVPPAERHVQDRTWPLTLTDGKVVDANDLVAAGDATGIVRTGGGAYRCAGVMIDDRHFLTAARCAPDDRAVVDLPRNAPGTAQSGMVIDRYEVEVITAESDTLDFQILRLDGAPGRTHGHVDVRGRDLAPDDGLVVVSAPSSSSAHNRIVRASYFSSSPPHPGRAWIKQEQKCAARGAPVFDAQGFLVGILTYEFGTIGGLQDIMSARYLIDHAASVRERAFGDVPYAADFDGDGIDELVIWRPDPSGGGGHLYAKGIDGTTTVHRRSLPLATDGMRFFDVDGDGRDEVVGRVSLRRHEPVRAGWQTWYALHATRSPSYVDGVTVTRGVGSDAAPIFDRALDIATLEPWSPTVLVTDRGGEAVDTHDGTLLTIGTDGDAVPVVYDHDTGAWSFRDVGSPGLSTDIRFGAPGDVPLSRGATDRDEELVIYRPSTRSFYIESIDGRRRVHAVPYGLSEDVPVVGNFDRDPSTLEVAMWRPSSGHWYVRDLETGRNIVRGLKYGNPR